MPQALILGGQQSYLKAKPLHFLLSRGGLHSLLDFELHDVDLFFGRHLGLLPLSRHQLFSHSNGGGLRRDLIFSFLEIGLIIRNCLSCGFFDHLYSVFKFPFECLYCIFSNLELGGGICDRLVSFLLSCLYIFAALVLSLCNARVALFLSLCDGFVDCIFSNLELGGGICDCLGAYASVCIEASLVLDI